MTLDGIPSIVEQIEAFNGHRKRPPSPPAGAAVRKHIMLGDQSDIAPPRPRRPAEETSERVLELARQDPRKIVTRQQLLSDVDYPVTTIEWVVKRLIDLKQLKRLRPGVFKLVEAIQQRELTE